MAEGSFRSPFELRTVAIEQGGFGPLSVEIERRGRRLALAVVGVNWRMRLRPHLAGPELDPYLAALARLGAGEVDEGLDDLEALADRAAARGESGRQIFFLWRRAFAHRHHRRPEVLEAYEQAIAGAAELGDVWLQAQLLDHAGYALQALHRQAEAVRLFERGLELHRASSPRSLVAASSMDQTGVAKLRGGERDEGLRLLHEAHALREELAPGSLGVAHSLNNLGNYVADPARGEEYHEQALAIRQRIMPGTVELAQSLSNLGLFAWQRDDLSRAEVLLVEALTMLLELEPDSRSVAMVTANLALVALERGHLDRAEERIRPSLRYFESEEPGGRAHAEAWNMLGTVLKNRRDLTAAEAALLASLEILEAVAPESARVANSLTNLGAVSALDGRTAQAEEYFRRAIALHETLAESPRELALARLGLGNLLRRQGRLDEAQEVLEQGLAALQRLAPGGQNVAQALASLGQLAGERGEPARAEALYRQTLVIARRLTPDSYLEALAHKLLAGALRDQGRIGEAMRSYDRAIAALEAQIGRLGGSEEDRIGYRASVRDFYQEYIDLLLEEARPDVAFAVLERSRAQVFLTMLAGRDLVFAADLPASLDRERRRLGREHDRVAEEIRGLSPSENAMIEERLARLEQLRRRRREIREEVRRRAPRVAALEDPQPLTLAKARDVLGGETTVLSYDVAEARTHLFILGPTTGLRVQTLSIGEAELAERVQRLRDLLSGGGTGIGVSAGLRRRASELWALLVAPAAPEIEAGRQLLIVPDGPLHALPFAALGSRPERAASGREKDEAGGEWSYLVDRRPLRLAVSLTSFAELQAMARSQPAPTFTLVAFGDPDLPADVLRRSDRASTGGTAPLARLPYSRQEVLAIARSIEAHAGGTGPPRAHTFLGREASEARAVALSGSIPFLHFATHGVLDERFPLDSALVLSRSPEGEAARHNGILQAWEVIEQVRIESELAVLSACETAAGGELAGEGLSGLTRAFHFAGARSVLATLWRVSDRSTTALMTLFYDHLARGLDPGEALRAAQLELIRGPVNVPPVAPPRWWRRFRAGEEPLDASHPYHWAAFQLYGPGSS